MDKSQIRVYHNLNIESEATKIKIRRRSLNTAQLTLLYLCCHTLRGKYHRQTIHST